MKLGEKKNNNQLYVAFLSVLILAASLLPIFHLALYNTPTADDFAYGTPVHYVIKNGGSFFDIIRSVFENIRYTYFNWQGTYSSVLLFSIHPGIVNERLYCITPFLMIFMISIPFYAVMFIINNIETRGKIIIGSILSFIALQYMPSSADSIYWWNGASHYIVFWSLSILIIILQINIQKSPAKDKSFYIKLIISILGSFLICGGNYSSALSLAIVLFFITILSMVIKKENYIIFTNFSITFLSSICLMLSVLAPGNDIRQASYEKLSALSAVSMSFKEAFNALILYTDIKMIITIILCTLIFLTTVKSGRVSISVYPHPLIIIVISFCIYAAQYTPPLYSMGECDIPRLNNILYLGYLIFVFGNSFYIISYILQKFNNINFNIINKNLYLLVLASIFLASALFSYRTSNAYIAYSDLNNDALEEYNTEIQRRENINYNKQDFDEFHPIIQYPLSFHPSSVLTWMPNLIIDGKASNIKVYRSCGGEVTYIGLEDAINCFDTEIYNEDQFTKKFLIDKKICVPLREFTDKQGFTIKYDADVDTIFIST